MKKEVRSEWVRLWEKELTALRAVWKLAVSARS